MPDEIDANAIALMNGVRDNLLKPMHDSLAGRIDRLSRLCRIAIWLCVVNGILLVSILAYTTCALPGLHHPSIAAPPTNVQPAK